MRNKTKRSPKSGAASALVTTRTRHNITFSPVAHERGKALAKEDRRSFSSELEHLVDKEWLARNPQAQTAKAA